MIMFQKNKCISFQVEFQIAAENLEKRQVFAVAVSPKLSAFKNAQFSAIGIEEQKLMAIQTNEQNVETKRFLSKKLRPEKMSTIQLLQRNGEDDKSVLNIYMDGKLKGSLMQKGPDPMLFIGGLPPRGIPLEGSQLDETDFYSGCLINVSILCS
jgi:hypothetical protein